MLRIALDNAVSLASILMLAAVLLGGCVSSESWEATRLLQDIDAAGGPSTLKAETPRPRRSTLRYEVEGRSGVADLYEPGQPVGGALVLVPGFTEAGRNDWRLVELARSLARARFLVLVPELPGARQLRVRPEDSRNIADAVIHLRQLRPAEAARGLGVVAISYAVGLAVLAAVEVEEKAPVDFLVGVGGYYDSQAVVTFATTGRFRAPGEAGWQRGAPLAAAKWIFLASNAAVLDDAEDRRRLEAIGRDCFDGCDVDSAALAAQLGAPARSLLDLVANEDPARLPRLLAALPEKVTQRMHQLSLSRQDLSPLRGRLILIHGRLDPLIPYTESLALARAVPGSEVFIIDGFSHITPRGVGWAGQLQLVNAIKAVLARRRLPSDPAADVVLQ